LGKVMGKKNGDKAMEASEESDNFVTREELDHFNSEIQKKLDDFAQGQVELHMQQAMAACDFQKGFDRLAAMIANMSPQPGAPRVDLDASIHQSSVHGQGDLGNNDHAAEHGEAISRRPHQHELALGTVTRRLLCR
jgi:hypothetical protein